MLNKLAAPNTKIETSIFFKINHTNIPAPKAGVSAKSSRIVLTYVSNIFFPFSEGTITFITTVVKRFITLMEFTRTHMDKSCTNVTFENTPKKITIIEFLKIAFATGRRFIANIFLFIFPGSKNI